MGFAAPVGYYDHQPSINSATGDIWSGLPSFGLFKLQTVSGIVITPACDLANGKSETITFLPIMPVADWRHSPTFLSHVQQQLSELIDKLELRLVDRSSLAGERPTTASLAEIHDAIEQRITATSKKPELELKKRIDAGLTIIRALLDSGPTRFADELASVFFGRKLWEQELTRIVTNAHRQDIHFLPKDDHDPTWSAVKEHSVALFRYPLTLPEQVFGLFNDLTIRDWKSQLAIQCPSLISVFSEVSVRPLKSLRLRKDFLVDLLTRFTALYTRLGSPDFSARTIETLRDQIKGQSPCSQ